MSKTLTLAVMREYFEQIKSGVKPDEYRLDTPYWRKRLIGREYDFVEITLGYPKADDTERRLKFPYRGYSMEKRTHKHFGAEEVTVFAIHLKDTTHDQ